MKRIDVMMIGLRSVDGGQGGVERHVASLAQELDRLGVYTCIVVRTPYSAADTPPPGPKTWTKRLWAPKHAVLEALIHSIIATCYAAIRRPAILHVHAVGPSIVIPLARLFGLRVVSTHHGEDYAREKWGKVARLVLRLGEVFQARFAQTRLCVSRSLSERLTGHYGIPFEYVPNAVSVMSTGGSLDGIKQFGLVPGRYIVNVSRLVPEKRQNDLIAAYARLARRDYKLVLVGAADHESKYAEDLRTLADATPGVVMTGAQRGELLAQLIAGSAVFALPSSHEGMPIAALEAMGLSRPVLLSNIAPNLDLDLPNENYHVMGSIEDLSTRLAALLREGSEEELPSHDWSAELESFTWANVAAQTLGIYRRVSPRITSQ